MNKIVRIKFGSHLYGTNTPNSDLDYKGIFMPEKKDIYLGKIPKSLTFNSKNNSSEKNTRDDCDEEFYSLHYFLELACKGETVALDMLHAPIEMCEFFSDSGKEIWDYLVWNKYKFYTKNLKAFIGYCRTQASKYGIKGSRLSDAYKVVNFLQTQIDKYYSIKGCWDELPEGEHIFKVTDEKTGIRMYEVCGRKIQETARVEYAYEILRKFCQSYGERAKLAKENKNIDWKAISHAIRVAFEMKEVYEHGTITFPLPQADYLKEVKAGLLDYTTDVAPFLEKLIEEVEELSMKSDYPEKVDKQFWEFFLMYHVDNFVSYPFWV